MTLNAGSIKDLDDDHAVLEDLLNRIEDIGPDDDDKLARLKEFLSGVTGEKVLIFSEAETTVDYLFEQLNPGAKDSTIAKLSGSNRDQRASIVGRFAPQANLQDKQQPEGRRSTCADCPPTWCRKVRTCRIAPEC